MIVIGDGIGMEEPVGEETVGEETVGDWASAGYGEAWRGAVSDGDSHWVEMQEEGEGKVDAVNGGEWRQEMQGLWGTVFLWELSWS